MLRGLPPAIFGGRSEGANRPPAADGGAAYTATQSGQRSVHWRTRLLLLRCCERKMYVSGHVVARLAQAYASTPPRASPSPPSPNAWRLGQRWLAPACPASPLRERLALFARTGHQTHTPTQHTHTHTHTHSHAAAGRVNNNPLVSRHASGALQRSPSRHHRSVNLPFPALRALGP